VPATYHPLKSRADPALLSLVIPLYNEEQVIPALRQRLTALVEQLPCPAELILVNDGSSDGTIGLLLKWAEEDGRIKVLGLARNFGHQAAVTAGLDESRGEAVVVMDADLQDPPELIPEMLAEYRKGYEVVYAQRRQRQGESIFKRFSAWAFYRFMRKYVHPDLPPDTGDFRLISRPCLDALRSMRETHRFLRGMTAWVGFAQTAVQFDRPARAAGKTNYPLRKMIQFAWTAAISFSPMPIRISLGVGVLLASGGFVYGVYAVVRVILGLPVAPGWTSLMVALCLIGGGLFVCIGIIGEYVARIFEEVKGRPLYIVSTRANLAEFDKTAPTPTPRD
jgi:glycosyltransferase involved in cell wall biosynthesis